MTAECCGETTGALERMRWPGAWLRCPECGTAHARDKRGATNAVLAGVDPSIEGLRDLQTVSVFVADLMIWRRQIEHYSRLSRVVQRPNAMPGSTARIASVAQSGLLGTGNKGTKGVWTGDGPVDALAESVDSSRALAIAHQQLGEWSTNMSRCSEQQQRVVVRVRDDTEGERPRRERPTDEHGYVLEMSVKGRSKRVTGLSLAQHLGLLCASAAQGAKWQNKILSGDSKPSLESMRLAGEQLLIDAAHAWFGIVPIQRPCAQSA